VLAPDELKDERDRLDRAGTRYAVDLGERTLPVLPEAPSYDDWLRRAFQVSGDLETAWQEWRAALAEVSAASAWPNTNVELDFEHVFSGESGSAWDRTSVGLGFDSAEMLELPKKTRLRGRVAFEEARMARERFRKTKFALERRFTEIFVEWVSAREELAAAELALELLRTSSASLQRAAAASPNALGFVRARIEIAETEDEIERKRSAVARSAALVMSSARVVEVLQPTQTPSWPNLVAPTIDDATWIALAARSNPMLAEFAHTVAGRTDALELARAAWWPDVAPFAGFTGSLTRFVGATLSIPTQTAKIRASIEAAAARLDGVRASSSQGAVDVRAGVTLDLIALREAERALRFSNEVLQPMARELAALARAAYAGGTAGQIEWLDALRAENDVKTAQIAARATRETSLARLQEWVGIDIASIDASVLGDASQSNGLDSLAHRGGGL